MRRPYLEMRGLKSTGRTEEAIRANIPNIPMISLLSDYTTAVMREILISNFWEEINLNTMDLDYAEALAMNAAIDAATDSADPGS